MATGQVLFHRFYYKQSFRDYDLRVTVKAWIRNNALVSSFHQEMAMACLFLSAKAEEKPRKLRELLNVFHHTQQLRAGEEDPQPLDITSKVPRATPRVARVPRHPREAFLSPGVPAAQGVPRHQRARAAAGDRLRDGGGPAAPPPGARHRGGLAGPLGGLRGHRVELPQRQALPPTNPSSTYHFGVLRFFDRVPQPSARRALSRHG